MREDEWIEALNDGRRVKFVYQELPQDAAFMTAQIEKNEVVYSILLYKARNPLTREVVKRHFEKELAKKQPHAEPNKPEGRGMTDTNRAVDKLQSIQDLWRQLGRTKVDAAEYESLMKKIRVLSAEYQALVDGASKRDKSK